MYIFINIFRYAERDRKSERETYIHIFIYIDIGFMRRGWH